MSESKHSLKVDDLSKEKGLEDFTRILEKFLSLSEELVVNSHYHYQNETDLQKKYSYKSAPQPSDTSKLARGQFKTTNGKTLERTESKNLQRSSDAASAQRHQKKGFFRRAKDKLLRPFHHQSTSREVESKDINSKHWPKKKTVQKNPSQNEENDKKSNTAQMVYKRTFPPTTNGNLHSYQAMSDATRGQGDAEPSGTECRGFNSPGGAATSDGVKRFFQRESSHFSSTVRSDFWISDNITTVSQDVNVESCNTQQTGQKLPFSNAQMSNSFPTKCVLDEPSEDIKFIDDDDDDDDSNRELVKRGGKSADQDSVPTRGTPRPSDMSCQASPPAGTEVARCSRDYIVLQMGSTGVQKDVQIHDLPRHVTRWSENQSGQDIAQLQDQSFLEEDGDSNDDFPDGKVPTDEAEGGPPCIPVDSKKDEVASEIAEKIMAIGDMFVNRDGKTEGDDLTALERELVECLRTLGDSYSESMEGPGEKIMQEVTDPTYQRFKEIIKYSLGNEISWNHLVILFYTVKGLASLVGRGSTLVSRAATFASRYYVNDLHGWVSQHGGFQYFLDQMESGVD